LRRRPSFLKFGLKPKKNLAADAVKHILQDSESEQPPASENQAEASSAVVVFSEEKTDNLANDLISILKDNIKKVSTNPAYIKQAMVVDKSVGTILNVKRMQLDMYKAVKSTKQKATEE
jgi:predicted site-specific integrase-resolvase